MKSTSLILVPTYGRDYTTAAAALADFKVNKDFKVMDISCQWDGKPANRADIIEYSPHIKTVKIRFNKREDFCFIDVAACTLNGDD